MGQTHAYQKIAIHKWLTLWVKQNMFATGYFYKVGKIYKVGSGFVNISYL